jgi:hypothetical protein
MSYYRNENVDLSDNDLYNLVREQSDNDHLEVLPGIYDDQKQAQLMHQEHQVYDKQEKQSSPMVNFLWILLLLVIVGVLLYLTFIRYALAGKSFYKGNNLAGFAMMSPEVASIVKLGLAL